MTTNWDTDTVPRHVCSNMPTPQCIHATSRVRGSGYSTSKFTHDRSKAPASLQQSVLFVVTCHTNHMSPRHVKQNKKHFVFVFVVRNNWRHLAPHVVSQSH